MEGNGIKGYNYKDIENFFANLEDSKTPRLEKYRAYGAYLEGKKIREKKDRFLKFFQNTVNVQYDVELIGDEGISGILRKVDSYGTVFIPAILIENQLDGDTEKKVDISIGDSFWSFEEALIGLLCLASGNKDAFEWVRRLLNNE